jgi:hypothetical protein
VIEAALIFGIESYELEIQTRRILSASSSRQRAIVSKSWMRRSNSTVIGLIRLYGVAIYASPLLVSRRAIRDRMCASISCSGQAGDFPG